jgi:hypothetical protein
VLWTLTVLSALIGVYCSTGFDPTAIQLSTELLGLMGISYGSAVLATAAKTGKDAPGSTARVEKPKNPQVRQIWLEEEGTLGDKVVSITKFQNLTFTAIILLYFVVETIKANKPPTDFPDNIVWLLGISHAGYIGGKVPDKH